MTTDIEKAFLHVHLHEKDRDFTQFFWLDNPSDPESELVVYRFKTVLFGAVKFSFHIVCATLYYHLQQHNTPLSRQTCMLIMLFQVGKLKLIQFNTTMKPEPFCQKQASTLEPECSTASNFVLLLSRIRPLIQVLQAMS